MRLRFSPGYGLTALQRYRAVGPDRRCGYTVGMKFWVCAMKLECILNPRKNRGPQKRRSALPILSTCAVFILLLAQFGLARGPRVAATRSAVIHFTLWRCGTAAAKLALRCSSAWTPRAPERWGKDLDQIKAVGFNTVKCWVDWATAEPKPGEFDFQNLDLLMRLAAAARSARGGADLSRFRSRLGGREVSLTARLWTAAAQ